MKKAIADKKKKDREAQKAKLKEQKTEDEGNLILNEAVQILIENLGSAKK
jgi:hypothetical protein